MCCRWLLPHAGKCAGAEGTGTLEHGRVSALTQITRTRELRPCALIQLSSETRISLRESDYFINLINTCQPPNIRPGGGGPNISAGLQSLVSAHKLELHRFNRRPEGEGHSRGTGGSSSSCFASVREGGGIELLAMAAWATLEHRLSTSAVPASKTSPSRSTQTVR